MSDSPSRPLPVVLWWILWAAPLGSLLLMERVLPTSVSPVPDSTALSVGIATLCGSCFLRWFLLPRQSESSRALLLFIAGLALAEACALLGLLLSHDVREELFVAGLLGVFQYLPVFAARFSGRGKKTAASPFHEPS